MTSVNPILPGFNPDPSVVRVFEQRTSFARADRFFRGRRGDATRYM